MSNRYKTEGLKDKIVMRLFIKRIFIAVLLSLCFFGAHAAHTITQEQWHKLTDNKAFGYKNDKEVITPPKTYEPGMIQKLLKSLFNFFGSGGGNILLWAIVIGVVCYVVYRLFFSKDSFLFSRSKRMVQETGPPQQEEQDLATTNWETLLQQAAANNDLRLAVRYSYMRLLQLLQHRELIKFSNDKTNYEYYTELDKTKYKQPFKLLSRQYEYTWYGNYLPSAPAYAEYLAQFNNLKKELGA